MIYFENYQKGFIGLNNQLISYTLCLSLSKFLERDFFYDYENPSQTPPDYAVNSNLKDKFKALINAKRSLVTDLLNMPARRSYAIERDVVNKIRYDNITKKFMTTGEQQSQYKNTLFWDFFRLSRKALVKEELQSFDLIEIGESNLVNVSYFYFLNKKEKTEILDSTKIRYTDSIESLAKKISGELGGFNSVHVRLGDFLIVYGGEGSHIKFEKFRKYLEANIVDKTLPVLIATDALQEKELFAALLKGYRYVFIDELVFENYGKEFFELEFTDFNVLTVINQLLCAGSESFIGTCRSTFTGIIHRLRQERFGKTDFNFHPDDLISELLTARYKIEPDRQGLFDWNRYSVFSGNYSDACWMREWNYDFTSLNIISDGKSPA